MENSVNRRKAKKIRADIRDNENGRGKNVYGIALDSMIRFRIYQVRVRGEFLEGRCLNSGEWVKITSWILN